MGLHIRLLGALEMELDGARIELPPGRRLRALTGWLALHPGGQPRARLAAWLWPDVTDASARASLRSAIWALRGAVGPASTGLLVADRDSVGFCPRSLTVDVAEFGRLANAGRLAEAVALCRGELLSQLADDWVFEAREQHTRRLASVLGQLARQGGADGQAGAAVTWARRRVALCPLDEAAGRDLMRRLADSGDVAGALIAYNQLRHRLSCDLGVLPARATRRVAERLRTRQVAALAGGPATPATGTPAPDLPPPAAPGPAGRLAGPGPAAPALTGRDADLAALTSAWRACQAGAGRVALVSGEGGIGKTRLAGALLDRAHRAQAAAVTCDAAAEPPYGLWSQVLAAVLAGSGHPPAGACWAADLAALHPAFGPAPPPDLLGAGRARLFEAVVALLAWACGRRPMVLALDDLHLADPASLDLLGYAGRRVGGMRLLLVLSRRQLPARPQLGSLLAAFRAHGMIGPELSLGPLPPAAAHQLASRSARLSARDVSRAVTVADGNPRLVVETAQAISRGDLPGGLETAVAAATRGLHPPARRFLELAALAGRDLAPGEVATLPLADPAGAATEALGCGLLRPAGDRVGYHHPVLCEAVREQIPGPLRRRLRDLLTAAFSAGHPAPAGSG